jgi:hypothetical protein
MRLTPLIPFGPVHKSIRLIAHAIRMGSQNFMHCHIVLCGLDDAGIVKRKGSEH